MNNQITNELQSFMKDYAADPTPRDFAIAQHFYNLALEDVRKEIERRLVDLNTRPNRYLNATASIWSLKSLASFIDNQKQ